MSSQDLRPGHARSLILTDEEFEVQKKMKLKPLQHDRSHELNSALISRSWLPAVGWGLLCAILACKQVSGCSLLQQDGMNRSRSDGGRRQRQREGAGSRPGVQRRQKRRPDASQFQLGNGSWQQAWATHTWTLEPERKPGRIFANWISEAPWARKVVTLQSKINSAE